MNKKLATGILVIIFLITACSEMPEDDTAVMQTGMSKMVIETVQE